MRPVAFEHRLSVLAKAVIETGGRRDQLVRRALAQISRGTELDLEGAQVGDTAIGADEEAVGPGRLGRR